jgi:uridine kinase
VVERMRRGEKFSVPELYNLANGQHDRVWEIDATDCRLVVLEGLFALHEELADVPDVRLFLEVDPDVALERARQRDLVDRNIDPVQFDRKIRIYFDRYAPHVESLRARADLVHVTG